MKRIRFYDLSDNLDNIILEDGSQWYVPSEFTPTIVSWGSPTIIEISTIDKASDYPYQLLNRTTDSACRSRWRCC